MQLTYRGAHYEYTPRSAETVRETTVFRTIRPAFNLHYRGSVYTVDPNAEPDLAVMHSTAKLMYRGATYTLNGEAGSAAVASDVRAVVTSNPGSNRKSNATAFSMVHRNNLQTNLQRRLQVARERGDQNLISLLERELQQIA